MLQTVDFTKMVPFSVVHFMALSSPFVYSGAGLGLCVVMILVLGQLGVVLGYHRLLAHHSYRTCRTMKYMLALCGVLAVQGGPISWVAIHRSHHRAPDQLNDPHSPMRSVVWSYLLWVFLPNANVPDHREKRLLARDIAGDAVMTFLEERHTEITLLFASGLFVGGVCIGGVPAGLSLLVWGYCIPLVYTWHATALVVAATHRWGYRSYRTADNSRNLWWVSVFTFGEGWHNNHHADSRSAMIGHRWFEIDPTYKMIRAMELIGLAYRVRVPGRTVIQRLSICGRGLAFTSEGQGEEERTAAS
ncbi:MAG TPA: fatty acid desaturase [Nitrospira sp.]|nr:fatty acid desaturase [Nitrospira sp.]